MRRLVFSILAGMFLSGCGPQVTPTFFVPPTMAAGAPLLAIIAPSGSPVIATEVPAVPTPLPPSPTPPCTDGLTYIQDLTIPDGSVMAPGQLIDKRWQVSNSGTCNWDERYALAHVSGDSMGVDPSLPLYPARAGTEATVRILFTAPQTAGTYESQWQAVNPDGVPFGNPFFMQIVVSP
jgi:hypothetical protein